MAPQYYYDSAHDLADLVRRHLFRPGWTWSRDVSAKVGDDGAVVLTGRVRSYYHKQMAQEKLRHLQGIRRIQNELCVERRPATDGQLVEVGL